MKRLIFMAVILFLSASALLAQKPQTGARSGGSYKLIMKGDSTQKEIRRGDLNVDKLLRTELAFSLEYNTGPADIHSATISGTAYSKDGKFYVFNGGENMRDCKLQFTVKNSSTVYLKMISGKTDCGLDEGDDPSGSYTRYAQ
jgi:hypothetical protein